jgi:hypothetical protein
MAAKEEGRASQSSSTPGPDRTRPIIARLFVSIFVFGWDDLGYMMMKEKIWITRLVLWNVVIVGIVITEANAWLIVFFFH